MKSEHVFAAIVVLSLIGLFMAASCRGKKPAPTPEPEQAVASLVRFEVYRDAKREWRWRMVRLGNNKIVADSAGDGYHNFKDCLDAIAIVRSCGAAEAKIMPDEKASPEEKR